MENEKTTALVVHESEALQRSSQLIALAVEKGACPETLERLLDLQLRWEKNEERKAFTEALVRFRAEGVHIVKNRQADRGRAGGFSYADLPEVVNAITPALSKCDLTISYGTEVTKDAITVSCELSHVAGGSKTITLSAKPDDTGGKTPLMAVASTITFLKRHLAMAVLGLAAEEDKNAERKPHRQETPEELVDRVTAKSQAKVDQRLQPATEQQIERLKQLAKSADVSEQKRSAIEHALADQRLTQGRAGALIGEGKRDETAERPQPPPEEG
jgi:hypothetical protein